MVFDMCVPSATYTYFKFLLVADFEQSSLYIEQFDEVTSPRISFGLG